MLYSVVRIVLLSRKLSVSPTMTGSKLFGYIIFHKKLHDEKPEVQLTARKVKAMFYFFCALALLACLIAIIAPFV